MGKFRYENMNGVSTSKSFAELRQWRKERSAKRKDLSYVVPHCPDASVEWLQENKSRTAVTWIGHATFLVQMNGVNLLTDPVWAEKMGFEKRLAPPGIALEKLPTIDAVLLSHSHYDHMHIASLKALRGRNPGMKLYVPAGLAAPLRRRGFERITELNWWEKTEIEGLEFHFVPAQHWSRRTLTDTNRSHWGGWIIGRSGASKEEEAIYFAGDSGYFPGFKLIGERFRIGTALMPIGAYEPEWFMGNQHVTPEQAVQAFVDCGAARFVPMHYGAFRLADDTPREALDRLLAEWERRGLPQDRLHVLLHGGTLKL